ncbi:hypothetical protein PFISCL1PPCAC_27456, partial [Pristionchus fissidentatus]
QRYEPNKISRNSLFVSGVMLTLSELPAEIVAYIVDFISQDDAMRFRETSRLNRNIVNDIVRNQKPRLRFEFKAPFESFFLKLYCEYRYWRLFSLAFNNHPVFEEPNRNGVS